MLQSASQRIWEKFLRRALRRVLGPTVLVIPLFQRQLQRGGLLTVRIRKRRYFMSIPRPCVSCCRPARWAAAAGVRRSTWASRSASRTSRQLVRLAGLTEGVDIEIVFTGVRPGEKLCEGCTRTGDDAHHAPRAHPHVGSPRRRRTCCVDVARLEAIAEEGDPTAVKAQLH